MRGNTKSKWIEAGYDLFGKIGVAAFNVERLSMIVSLSRSSFYHHFSDMEIYESELFDHHIKQYHQLSTQLEDCQTFDPDLLNLISSTPKVMAFQRQLLINEASPRFKACFDTARVLVEDRIYSLWLDYIGVKNEDPKEFSLFEAVRDYFLIHHDQSNDDDIQATIEDIQLLLHGKESVT